MTHSGARRSRPVATVPEVSARQLRAVAAVAEYRSFVAAAAHLGISQPALTLSIRRLEEMLGLALFIRTTRQVTVTAAGREFVAMAERVLNDLSRGMRSLQELSDRHRGHVTVASLITLRMSAVVAEYNKRFPGVEIELREGFEDDVKEDVRGGVADFGLGYIGELPSCWRSRANGCARNRSISEQPRSPSGPALARPCQVHEAG